MSRLFIDTNVLISAIVFDRNELEIIKLATNQGHELLISEHILEEANRVFEKKFPNHLELYQEFLDCAGLTVIPRNVYKDTISEITSIRDKFDAHVIACAEKTKCDLIISGDKDLLSFLDTEVKVLTARQFLAIDGE